MAVRLEPITGKDPWGTPQARHLLNRAGFGITEQSVARLVSMGPAAAVDSLVNYERFRDNLKEPDFLTARDDAEGMLREIRGLSEEERQRRRQVLQRQQRQEMEQLKTWWLNQMRTTTRPLQEKMTLFWHGHFATSAEKVKLPRANYELNEVFRQNATGSFRSMVFLVGKSEAMLRYLDNMQNRKGHPNENWARELLELFTLGIGHYSEEDIKEAARAFTGYTLVDGQFKFVDRQHDYGEKTFLGKTGDLDGADVINIIFEHPKAPHHICRKLWEYFAYESPDEALLEELAAEMRAADFELKPLLQRIFLSREFYSDRAMLGQVKSPAQYMVMLVDQLQLKPEDGRMINLAMRAMGQELFYPPNVKGWDGNRAWINTNTLLLRYNVPGYLLTGERPNIRPDQRLDETMEVTDRKRPPVDGRTNDRVLAMMQDRAGLDVRSIWTATGVKTAGEAIDTLASRLLGRPLLPEQRTTLLESLGTRSATAPFDTRKAPLRNLSGTLHLILSMAEYQLC